VRAISCGPRQLSCVLFQRISTHNINSMDVETINSENNIAIMAQAQLAIPEKAPGQQAISSDSEHRPLLKVDRTGGITGARCILIPVDDNKVYIESCIRYFGNSQ